jgi:hypothetical protein
MKILSYEFNKVYVRSALRKLQSTDERNQWRPKKQKDTPYLWTRKYKIIRMSIFSKVRYRFHGDQIQIMAGYFVKAKKFII